MGTITANGLRFSTLEWGDGPLVLCLHGFPDTAYSWDVVGPALTGFRVVAPFLRGYAPTEIPARDADSRTIAEDTVALVDALGGGPAVLVGHDWGAEAAYGAVALAPDRFRKLVTIAIPHRAAVPFTPSLLWALRHFVTLRLPGAVDRFLADDLAGIEVYWKRWSPTWRYTAEELAHVKDSLRQPGSANAALGYYRSAELLPADWMKVAVQVPTLSIAGTDDPGVSPEVFDRCAPQFAAGYRVARVPGGHFCHREAPDAVIAAIREFLG